MTTNNAINANQTLDTAATPTFATLTLTGAGLTPLNLVSTDAGAAAGPIIDVYRNSASPAAADIVGQMTFTGASSTAVKRIYSQISGNIVTATNASEDGSLTLAVMSAGTLTTVGTVNKTGINSTAVGATTTSTGAFTTLASSTSMISTTATASTTLPIQAICTAAGSSTVGPSIDMYRNTASSNGNSTGQYAFSMLDSSSVKVFHGGMSSSIISNTNTAVSGGLQIFTLQGGTQKNVLNTTANGAQHQGNNINTVSPAGYIGEVLSSTVANTTVSLTSGVNANVTNITVTPGNWLISGSVGYLPAGTISVVLGGVTPTSANPTTPAVDFNIVRGIAATSSTSQQAPLQYLSIASNTTYYLVASCVFTVTCTAGGSIQAVRIG